MTARCWYKRSDNADQVVVHVSWVPQGLRARRHDRSHLKHTTIATEDQSTNNPQREEGGGGPQRQDHDFENNTHELIGLVKRGPLQVQTIRVDARQRAIVEHDDRVGVIREPLERQQRVVRLHDHVALLRVREDRVGLHQLLRELVVQPLEQERAQSRASPACDRVHQHETLGRK